MSIASQLYRLQEIDQELAASEQSASRITGQLGDDRTVRAVRSRLEAERQILEELTSGQKSVEWETEDISSRLAKVDESLYSGRIRNPKELTDLQQEANMLKSQRAQLEEKTLEIMENVERASSVVAASEAELSRLEAEWREDQEQLQAELERLKPVIAELRRKREAAAAEIDAAALETYQELKKLRGTAVARVEQGLCQGCRISLPVGELQQVRAGKLVRCGSCGRLLYLG